MDKLKPDVKLSQFEIKPDLETQQLMEKFHNHVKSAAESLLKESPAYIYGYIGRGTFFPKKKDLLAASGNTKNAFMR